MIDFIPYGKQSIDEDDINSVVEVLKSDFLTTGPKIKEFEDELCRYTNAKYCVAVANGTAALHLASLVLLNKDDKYKPGGVLEDDISEKDPPEHVFHQGKLWDVEKNWFRYGRLMLRIGDNMKITKLKNCRYACLKKKEITD